MSQRTEEQQLRWCGHVMRVEDCRIARQVAEWNPQGKRRRSRPVSTWKDGIRGSMRSRKHKDDEYLDREFWRKKNAFRLRKIVYSQKNSFIDSNKNQNSLGRPIRCWEGSLWDRTG
jgi:hypothetical protein